MLNRSQENFTTFTRGYIYSFKMKKGQSNYVKNLSRVIKVENFHVLGIILVNYMVRYKYYKTIFHILNSIFQILHSIFYIQICANNLQQCISSRVKVTPTFQVQVHARFRCRCYTCSQVLQLQFKVLKTLYTRRISQKESQFIQYKQSQPITYMSIILFTSIIHP